MMILYADDDHDDREILFDTFNQIDPSIRCIGVNNGQEALEFLKKTLTLPDYIFLDLNMPMMDGKKCLSQLKLNASFTTIPVIIYSTTVHPVEIPKLYALGASTVIQKPSNLSQLKSTLPLLLKIISYSKQLINRV
jgi:CheY-like chemotaxis protein